MPAKQPSPMERAQSSFKNLASAASDLNRASDELGATISTLDQALKELNLGISGWVPIAEGEDKRTLDYWSREVGYAKVGSKWGIALREVSGNEIAPEKDITSWLFGEAPRWMRIEAIAKIPDLIDHLVKQAQTATERIKGKTAEAKALAEAINASTAQPEATDETAA